MASRSGRRVSVRNDDFEHSEAGDEESRNGDADDRDASLASSCDR